MTRTSEVLLFFLFRTPAAERERDPGMYQGTAVGTPLECGGRQTDQAWVDAETQNDMWRDGTRHMLFSFDVPDVCLCLAQKASTSSRNNRENLKRKAPLRGSGGVLQDYCGMSNRNQPDG